MVEDGEDCLVFRKRDSRRFMSWGAYLGLNYDIYWCGCGLDTDYCGRKRAREM